MKTIGWVLLGGGVLYLLDQMGYFGSATSTGVSTASAGTPVSTGGASTSSPQAAAPNPYAGQTAQEIIAALQAGGIDPNSLQTVWGWNYYYQQVRGVAGPDPSVVLPNSANPDTEKISFNQWWGAMQTAGFSGLGMIAHHVNPYLQGPRTAPNVAFGAGLAPTGMETYIKRLSN